MFSDLGTNTRKRTNNFERLVRIAVSSSALAFCHLPFSLGETGEFSKALASGGNSQLWLFGANDEQTSKISAQREHPLSSFRLEMFLCSCNAERKPHCLHNGVGDLWLQLASSVLHDFPVEGWCFVFQFRISRTGVLFTGAMVQISGCRILLRRLVVARGHINI